MKKCINRCGSIYPRENKYCWRCGEVLVESDKCECGYELSPHDCFCGMCGKQTLKDKERGGDKNAEECNSNSREGD